MYDSWGALPQPQSDLRHRKHSRVGCFQTSKTKLALVVVLLSAAISLVLSIAKILGFAISFPFDMVLMIAQPLSMCSKSLGALLATAPLRLICDVTWVGGIWYSLSYIIASIWAICYHDSIISGFLGVVACLGIICFSVVSLIDARLFAKPIPKFRLQGVQVACHPLARSSTQPSCLHWWT